MPSFALLPEDDLQAVIDYVLVLTHRGELEEMLLREAQSEDEIDPENVPMYAQRIIDRWQEAAHRNCHASFRVGAVQRRIGENRREGISQRNCRCFKCHGPDGRGPRNPQCDAGAGQSAGAPPT